jgi:type I restriction enzyme S subunit
LWYHFLQDSFVRAIRTYGNSPPSGHDEDLFATRIPLPPAAEQVRIADRIDELFTDLSAGVAALERVNKKLKRYRSAVLHAAVTGKLTAPWRAEQQPLRAQSSGTLLHPTLSSGSLPLAGRVGEGVEPGTRPNHPSLALPVEGREQERELISSRKGQTAGTPLPNPPHQGEGTGAESGAELLQRILKERRQQWEARTLAKYKQDGRTPPKNWRERYPAPAKPKTDELPELPEGWCWATHDQVGEVQLGRQRSPQHHFGEDMRPYLRVANVYEDRICTRDVKQMNFTPSEFTTYELKYGDILLNEGQSMELVGRPAMYRNDVSGCAFQNTLVRQRLYEGVIPEYGLYVTLAQFRTGRYRKIARITTSIAHLGAERFAIVEFPLPAKHEQAAIVDAVQEKLSQIDAMESEVERGLARASRLRQAILKAAFSGKLVPQDPNDEPAAVLLERIRAERAAAANGKPRKKSSRPTRAARVSASSPLPNPPRPGEGTGKMKRGRSRRKTRD